MKKRIICLFFKLIITTVFASELISFTSYWSAEYYIFLKDALVLSLFSYLLGMSYILFFALPDEIYDHIRNVLKKYF